VFPATATVNLKHELFDKTSPLTFGWEPDGSGMKWDNTKDKPISIESVDFAYELVGEAQDNLTEDSTPGVISLPEAVKAQTKEIREQFAEIRKELGRYAKILIFLLGAIVALLFFLLPRK
jgi:hypothetical protein